MWLFTLENNTERKFVLLANEDLIIGRIPETSYFVLPYESISRRHAVIKVHHEQRDIGNSDVRPKITLTDVSKHGTFVNDQRLTLNDPKLLVENDHIVFGTVEDKAFILTWQPLVVCSSSVAASVKQSLKVSIFSLGGHLVPDWTDDVTHVTMSGVVITFKAIMALINALPIVTPQFFDEYLESVRSKSAFPDPTQFIPPVKEATLVEGEIDFAPNFKRKHVFEGKTFHFVSLKQLTRLKTIIEHCNGKVNLLNESSFSSSQVKKSTNIYIGVDAAQESQLSQASSSSWIENVMSEVKDAGMRIVQETEVSLAILHGSTSNYCNTIPKVKTPDNSEVEEEEEDVVECSPSALSNFSTNNSFCTVKSQATKRATRSTNGFERRSVKRKLEPIESVNPTIELQLSELDEKMEPPDKIPKPSKVVKNVLDSILDSDDEEAADTTVEIKTELVTPARVIDVIENNSDVVNVVMPPPLDVPVEIVEMRRKVKIVPTEINHDGVPNFKKFKKVQSGRKGLPTIIGGSELEPFADSQFYQINKDQHTLEKCIDISVESIKLSKRSQARSDTAASTQINIDLF